MILFLQIYKVIFLGSLCGSILASFLKFFYSLTLIYATGRNEEGIIKVFRFCK